MTTKPNVNHPLSIFFWNAYGLSQHITELQHILLETNTDIALISEIHFNPNTYVKIHGFNAYFSCHPNGAAHAGAAIYIKSNITHHSIPPTLHPTFRQPVSH
jgi:hypothetical protein